MCHYMAVKAFHYSALNVNFLFTSSEVERRSNAGKVKHHSCSNTSYTAPATLVKYSCVTKLTCSETPANIRPWMAALEAAAPLASENAMKACIMTRPIAQRM